MEFLEQIHKLEQSGRGVCFTSHAREETIKTRSGDKYTRIFPSMSRQARTVIEAIVDFFFYAEYVKDGEGNPIRILVCHGDETVWAGARNAGALDFPQFIPMHPRDGYTIIRDAFLGKPVGLNPQTFMPAKSTSQTGRDFILKARTRAAVQSVRTVKKVGKA
jgi:hypothetical protein